MFKFAIHLKQVFFLGLTLFIFQSSAQSIHNLFDEENNVKIEAWIKANPKGNVDVFNDRLNAFYEMRLPVSELSCVTKEIHVLSLAILYENEKIVFDLLRDAKINKDADLMTEAFAFAVFKNKLAWAKEIGKSCQEINKPIPYFFGQNALQIALSTNIDNDLLQFVIQNSSDEAYRNIDCAGKSVMHYVAEFNHTALFHSKSNVLVGQLFIGNENLQFPLELAAAKGNLELVRLIWNEMKTHEGFQGYHNDVNLRRFNAHATLSNNRAINSYVDSLVVKMKKINRSELMAFYLGEQPFDLTNFIDQSLFYSDFFFDLTKMSEKPMAANFMDFLKAYQTYKKDKTGVDAGIQPTFHGRSGLVSFSQLNYISSFFTNFYWNSTWRNVLTEDELEALDDKQDPFSHFSYFPFPPKFQNNFSIDHGDLNGYRGRLLEVTMFSLSELPITHLKVKNVEADDTDYAAFFPRLEYLELHFTNSEMAVETFVELFYVRELKITGVQNLFFGKSPELYKLERLHVPAETVIENLPKGVKVSYF